MEISTQWILRIAGIWQQAITNPNQFLASSFQPTNDQVSSGMEFFIAMLAVSTVLSAPIALGQRGGLGEKAGFALNGFLGLITSALVVTAWHLPFVWLGGKATFSGTYLAYCYGASPYMPMVTFAALISVAGLPATLRKYAINPTTAPKAFAAAQNDPDTSKGTITLGGCLTLVVTVWSAIVTFRSLRLVHSLVGWKLAAAVLLSLVIAAPLSLVLRRLATLFLPPPEQGVPPI